MSVPFYLYEVIEKIVSRQQEIEADNFSLKNAEEGQKQSLKSALLQLFFKNKCDFVIDRWYSAVKNHHPTLVERIDNIERLGSYEHPSFENEGTGGTHERLSNSMV